MKRVGIAQLKARLGEYLCAVRGAGLRRRPKPRIRKPAPGTPPPGRVPLPKKPLKLDLDIVDVLLDERQGLR